MEIIRVLENIFDWDNEKGHTYVIMEVNWFRERVWNVMKYEGTNSLGEPELVYKQQSWGGIAGLLEGLQIKRDTLESRMSRSKSEGPVKVDLMAMMGHSKHDFSDYETVRYFPFLKGKWVFHSEFIEDIMTQNLEKDYPEYLI